ncbi:hypothetical protein LTR56_018480 [Elasticomyces elasticus]|nr:hypothetical protein LTR56_018480 [Elasticomyces elasticus]KAK3632670.1 hypothetical protein LTR22_020484 [Elasticomyces elasticus]KAK4912210.1 hypothetical protein LTR49_019306 [Elasticomyces elasticus]KAK5769345.1 hypothetical protein LTS12_000272 [Elasticomyces elasticus]
MDVDRGIIVGPMTATDGSTNTITILNGRQVKLEDGRNDILFLTDPEQDRDDLISAKGQRVAGTCEWIRKNATYRSWRSDETRLLWISGGPGKGKTILSIFLTEELESEGKDTVYYFCSSNDQKRNHAAAVLRGLTWHLIVKHPVLADQLFELQGDASSDRVQTVLGSRETLWKMFIRVLHDPRTRPTCCVLDGLDECDDDSQTWLVDKLTALLNRKLGRSDSAVFKLVILSRPDVFRLAQCTRIQIDPNNDEQVREDIRTFVVTRVRELVATFPMLGDDLQSTIEKTLLDRSEGTFLWVGFAVLALSKAKTATNVLRTLHALPSGLSSMYGRMLAQIDHDQRHTCSLILQWVTLAARPLTLLELATAAGIDAMQHSGQEQAVRDQLEICGPLVRTTKGKVTLVHQSAKDYLLSCEFSSIEGHLTLASACVKHLWEVDRRWPMLIVRDEDPEPFDDYAIYFWPSHAKGAGALAEKLLGQIDMFGFGMFGPYPWMRNRWWEEYNRNNPLVDCMERLPAIHMASYLGILPWVQALTRREKIPHFDFRRKAFRWLVNSYDEKGRTPLWWAALGGDVATSQWLVSHGARSEFDDGDLQHALRTALAMACCGGHTAEVLSLLTKGADVNGLVGRFDALQIASRAGHESIVVLLLAKGADPNGQGGDFGSALEAACNNDHEVIARLLLEAGADIMAQGGNALQSASLEGHETIVQFLIAAGVDINARGRRDENALQAASLEGHQAIVQLLLAAGADVDAEGGPYGNALQAASLKGRQATVQLLLAAGADVNAQGGTHGSALQAAFDSGCEGTMQLLLAAGADINAQCEKYGNFLQAASFVGHESVVRLLLVKGFDVNAQGGTYRNALQAASWNSHKGVVQLLLEHGAIPNWTGYYARRARSNYDWMLTAENDDT